MPLVDFEYPVDFEPDDCHRRGNKVTSFSANPESLIFAVLEGLEILLEFFLVLIAYVFHL